MSKAAKHRLLLLTAERPERHAWFSGLSPPLPIGAGSALMDAWMHVLVPNKPVPILRQRPAAEDTEECARLSQNSFARKNSEAFWCCWRDR